MEPKPSRTENSERAKIAVFQGDGSGFEYETIARVFAEISSGDTPVPFVYGKADKWVQAARNLGLNDPAPLVQKSIADVKGRRAQVVGPQEGDDVYELLQQAVSDIQQGHLRALVSLPLSEEQVRNLHPEFKNQALCVAQACGGNPFRMLLCGDDVKLNFLTGIQRPDCEQYLSAARVEQRIRMLYQSLKSDFAVTVPRIAVVSAGKDLDSDKLSSCDEKTLKPLVVRLFEEGLPVFGPYPAARIMRSPDIKSFHAVLCMYKEQMELCTSYFPNHNLHYYTAGIPAVHIEPVFTGLNGEDAFRSLYRAVCWASDISACRGMYMRISENPLPCKTPSRKENANE